MNKQFYFNLNFNLIWTEKEFNIVINDHIEMLDILGFLANTLFEKQIKDEPYKYYCEPLAFKYMYHSLSLNSLLNGTKFTSKIFNIEGTIFDISSTYIIQRSIIETYFTFNYLYIQPKSEEERKCKWLIYKIAGLNRRQDFNSIYIDYKEKIEKEKIEIKDSLIEINKNSYFLSLSPQSQKNIMKLKNAKVDGWMTLFDKSDINSDFIKKAWKLYSNYAHSEYISLIQFKDYRQNESDILGVKQNILLDSLIITAIFISDFKILYKEVENNFMKLSQDQIEFVNFFANILVKR